MFRPLLLGRASCRMLSSLSEPNAVCVLGKEYGRDEMTNVTPSLLDKVGRYLHNTRHHPINLIKERIVHHFHKTYTNNMGNPIYTSIEDTPPVVTTEQNFDSLHVSTRLVSVGYMHCNWKYCTGAVTLFHKIYIIIPNFQCHLFYYLSFSLSLSQGPFGSHFKKSQ